MRVAPLQQDVLLRADNKESRAESEYEQALEVDVAAIHYVEGAGLWKDLVEHFDIMHFPVCNTNKRWDISAQVEKRVQFDGGLVLAEPGPRKQRKT
jgi:hypothetical protein